MSDAVEFKRTGEVSFAQGNNVVDLPHFPMVLPRPSRRKHGFDVGHKVAWTASDVPKEISERAHPLGELRSTQATTLAILKPRSGILPVVSALYASTTCLTRGFRVAATDRILLIGLHLPAGSARAGEVHSRGCLLR